MHLPKSTIIGLSGVSGAGKTTLARKLGEALKATTLFWDDYDGISKAPADYVAWFHSKERNTAEWQYEALENVLKTLKSGKSLLCPASNRQLISTPYIIFDAPFGYSHKATGQYIDFLIFLDTPPDIALARRLIRDARDQNTLEELQFYLSDARAVYIDSYLERKNCDLIVDGSLSIRDQEKAVISSLLARSDKAKNESFTLRLRQVTRLGVYGVLVKDQKILLIKKQKGCYKGLLDLPGGGIEFGETPEETLRREIQEEVGMTFEHMLWVDNLSHCQDVLDIDDPASFHHLGHIYRISGESVLIGAEPEEQFEWYPLRNLDLQMLTPFARAACKHSC